MSCLVRPVGVMLVRNGFCLILGLMKQPPIGQQVYMRLEHIKEVQILLQGILAIG
jgi:hypothetical protein